MIKIIYGSKGTGKTKKIIDMANDALETTNGCIVFLADTKRYIREIKYKIRFLDTVDFEIRGEDMLIGFIKGLIAGNYDNKQIFIDRAVKMLDSEIPLMGSFMSKLDKISKENDVQFILTVSCDKENLPDFFAKYVND